MFAYCGNNLVNYADPTGNAYQGIFSQINYNEHDHTYGGLRENFYALPEETFLRKAEKYILNDDESVVLSAEDFAFYKGALVLKLPFMGKSAFSCGIIFMGSEIEDAATLCHEYGHYVHLSQIGFENYFTKAVVPSVIGFWAQVPQDKYYSLPWGYTADILGDANRTNYRTHHMYPKRLPYTGCTPCFLSDLGG